MTTRLLKCSKCGWVHFGVTRKDAETQVAEFNAYYQAASKETQENFDGPSSIVQYEKCFRCGKSHKEMRVAKCGDAPEGSTIQSIIDEVSD